jgi:hypothetical protein
MIRAIQENRKTMTRRVIIPQPPEDVNSMDYQNGFFIPIMVSFTIPCYVPDKKGSLRIKPKYDLGDRLWVRETVYFETFHAQSDAEIKLNGEDPSIGAWVYRADNEDYPTTPGKWSPSIFMPRKAARLFLDVTGIGAGKLSWINEADARAEGFNSRGDFLDYWEKLNGKRGFGVKTDPWVFYYRFVKAALNV